MTSQITPYKISVSDGVLASVKEKLSTVTFPEEVSFSNSWESGVPLAEIKRLATYWRDGFDWKKQEAQLNQLPHFTTRVNVEGFGNIDVHFVHQRSERADSIPLLFSHGWPGSFIEVQKILPLLTNPPTADSPSFHVVAPSLPNFGFSQAVDKPGFGLPHYAETVHKLMLQLGYDHYVTQGGDWGFTITRLTAAQYPEHCLATHINFNRANPPSLSKNPIIYLQSLFSRYTAAEKAGLERTKWFKLKGFGYNLLQGTKPSTIGFALADSPIALLAWIYEKLHDWTDSYPWTDDEILTWVSLYQFSTAGPAASVRIYYEARNAEQERTQKAFEYNSKVLLGISYFPKDLAVPPKLWGRTLGPLVFEAVHEDGGHFAAYERPEALVEDLRKMFGKGGGAEKVTRRILAAREKL